MKFINDKNINNNTYINKDFQALWAELLDIIPKYTNKWDPRQANESDPLAVLIKLLAIFSDKLNYNIDKSILENYPQTLTQERSAYNVYDILGYKAPWYKSALVNVNISANSIIQNVSNFTLPRFTMLSDSDNKIIYTTLAPVVLDFTKNTTLYPQSVLCMQGTINDFTINGETLITLNNIDNENRLYFSERNVAENGIFISNNAEFNIFSDNLDTDWRRVDNIYQSLSSEKCYEFAVDPSTGACYIQFSENISNLIGSGIYIKYILSNGEAGNIKQYTLSKCLNKIDIAGENGNITITDYLKITNPSSTTNGKNPATISEMYTNFKKTQNLCNTLVTLLDYENYIYDYEYANGLNAVSNIRVADRTNDLYRSYNIRTLTPEGGMLENYVIPAPESPTQNPILDENFTAFNLRFYPLENSINIYDKKSFDKTFNYPTSNKQKELDSIIQNTKALNYDPLSIGMPIIISYDLSGQVYLKNKYTKSEKDSILQNIKLNLYSKLNARKINFGEEPNFKEILDIIESSDDRINYVALSPITYSGIDYDTDSLSDINIYGRSALAGITQWINYPKTFNFTVNQRNNAEYKYTNTTNPATTESITVTPTIIISPSSDNIIEVMDNETLIFYTPDYKDEIIYSNYLYFVTEGIDGWVADTPITLGPNQSIKFYETRDTSKSIYTLETGDIIKPNFNYSASDYTGGDKVASLNNGNSIVKLTKNEGDIIPDDSSSLTLGYQVTTNSEGLKTAFSKNTPEQYTLMSGEYFIFKSSELSGITILGEGTTLSTKTQINFTNDPNINSTIDAGNLSDISIWTTITSNIHYVINKIYSFGAGYNIKLDRSWPTSDGYIISTGNLGTGTSIEYRLGNSGDYVSLPAILIAESYTYILKLDIAVEAFTEIKLINKPNHKQVLAFDKSLTGGSSPISEIPSANLSSNELVYAQLNTILITSGASVTLVLPQGSSFNVMEYIKSSTDQITTSDINWVKIPADGLTLPGNLPGTSGTLTISKNTTCFIIPIYANVDTQTLTVTNSNNVNSTFTFGKANEVKYIIALPGSKLMGNFSVLSPKATTLGIKIGEDVTGKLFKKFGGIDGVNTYSTTYTAIQADTTICPESNTNFNLTYIVDENVKIDNPTDEASFFNKNHIYNRYSIAKLANIDNLQLID